MVRILCRICDERGLFIVVFEQVFSFVLDIVDCILVIEKGEIVVEEICENVNEEKIVVYLVV